MTELEEIAREAAEKFRDEYTFSQPCCVNGEPDAQTVWLKIGNQSFSLDGYHGSEEVAYFRLMLGKALATFASRVTENAEKELREWKITAVRSEKAALKAESKLENAEKEKAELRKALEEKEADGNAGNAATQKEQASRSAKVLDTPEELMEWIAGSAGSVNKGKAPTVGTADTSI